MGRSRRRRYRSVYLSGAAITAVTGALGIEAPSYFVRNMVRDPDLIAGFLALHHSLDDGRDELRRRELVVGVLGRLFVRHGSGGKRVPPALRDRGLIARAIATMHDRHAENLGLGLAPLLAGWVPFKRLVIAVILAPYVITEVTAVVMWRYMLEPDVGMVNFALKTIGIGQIDWSVDPFSALMVVSLLAIWQHLPFTFLILYAAVTTIPTELVESAKVDGATAWQTFWHVTLRLILPAVFVALMFRYIFAMRIFSEVWLLTEGGPARMTEVLAVYLYRQAFRYHEFGGASATGWMLLVLSLVIALPYLRAMYVKMFRHG